MKASFYSFWFVFLPVGEYCRSYMIESKWEIGHFFHSHCWKGHQNSMAKRGLLSTQWLAVKLDLRGNNKHK